MCMMKAHEKSDCHFSHSGVSNVRKRPKNMSVLCNTHKV